MAEQPVNYYEILGLPWSPSSARSIGQEDIRQAYRRALLKNHPDKAAGTSQQGSELRSIDNISLAYKILSNPVTRAEQDGLLLLRLGKGGKGLSDTARHPGLEVVDLDDLLFDEAQGVWYRGCRCGNERGFLLTESDLEKESEYGEIVVGCAGCSLWLKVVFQLAVDD